VIEPIPTGRTALTTPGDRPASGTNAAALEIESLLADARQVVDYAARAGVLPSDALPNAIDAAERARASGAAWEVSSLATALDGAVKAIRPVSLLALREGLSPFESESRRSTKGTPRSVLWLAAFVLIGVIAFYSQLLHREDTALRTLQQLEAAQPLDRLNSVRKMVQYEGALEKNDSRYDEYHRAIRELRDLQSKSAWAAEHVTALADSAPWPFGSQLESLWDYLASLVDGSRKPEQGQRTAPLPPDDAAKALATPGAPSAPEAEPGDRKLDDPCDPVWADLDSVELLKYPAWLRPVIADAAAEFCFSFKINVGLHALNRFPVDEAVRTIEGRIAVQNAWVLPFLYGLLGQIVFLLRDLLNPRTPTVERSSAMLRIALGGMAGIMIGWFFVPAESKEVAITLMPFGLAFVAGFSIEILFSTLERITAAIDGLARSPG